ncbi:MAG: hypothetical protein VXA09_04785, partial [Burkholderiaceae bacterium]
FGKNVSKEGDGGHLAQVKKVFGSKEDGSDSNFGLYLKANFEDELILGNYSIAYEHVCRSLEYKRKGLSFKKNKEKDGAYRPFEVLRELMNK